MNQQNVCCMRESTGGGRFPFLGALLPGGWNRLPHGSAWDLLSFCATRSSSREVRIREPTFLDFLVGEPCPKKKVKWHWGPGKGSHPFGISANTDSNHPTKKNPLSLFFYLFSSF